MDLLTVSRLYHFAGTPVPLWIGVLLLAVLLLTAAHRKARGQWRLPAALARGAAAGAGFLVAGWLVAVELVLFRVRCPLCLAASAALVASFALAGFRAPRRLDLAAAVGLSTLAIAYLLPFGTIPKVAILTPPAPALDADSALRSRGHGALRAQVFGDFQCPACAQMDRTLERFLERHEGQVQRVFRHLPLASIHPWAERAAMVSECAARQGRFENARRTLFEGQAELGAVLARHPEEAWDLPDIGAFRRCVAERHAEGAVQKDVGEARRLGLRSTPSLVIGQTLVVGTVPLARLRTIVEFASHQDPAADAPAMKTSTSGCGGGLSGSGCSAS